MRLRRIAILIPLLTLAGPARATINGVISPPGGVNWTLQYNNRGVFGGDATLYFSTGTKVLHVSGLSVDGGQAILRSTTTGQAPVAVYFQANMTGDRMLNPLYRNVGFGDQLMAYSGYNFGGSWGTSGWIWTDSTGSEWAKLQVDGSFINGLGLNTGGKVANTLDVAGSFGIISASTTVNLTLGNTHYLILADATGGALTMTFPDLWQGGYATAERRIYRICKIDSTPNEIGFACDATDGFALTSGSLTQQGECTEIIGRVGIGGSFGTGSQTVGEWYEIGRTNRAGSTYSNLIVTNIFSLTTGYFDIRGSTVQLDQPSIDTVPRVLQLYNGVISFPAMANGADLDLYNNFLGSATFSNSGGVSVTYHLSGASMTATDTMTMPSGSAPTVDAVGEFAFDTTDNALVAYNGAVPFVVATASKTFEPVTISTPPGGWAGATIPLWSVRPDMAITLKSLRATCMDGTSITFNIEERAFASMGSAGTDILAADLAADTNGETATVFSNASIAAGAHLVLTVTSVSGSPNYLVLSGMYTEDVE